MTEEAKAADMEVRRARGGVSWVWIVPILALLISLGVAWQNYSQRGTLINIIFQNASGVTAGETVLKFRDVEVGTVEKVAFDDGLADVIVSVRVDNDVVPYLDDDAQFWVVRPDVSLRGVTGLETVLSGVFIEGSWDRVPDVAQTEFYGLETAPLNTIDQLGTAITLRTRDGSAISSGAPILHRGIQVGVLEAPRLSANGESVIVEGFVEFPYDRIMTTATRFWDTSGFSISLGANGVELDVNSIASLIEGGVAFDTVVSGGEVVPQGYVFDIFTDEETARSSVFVNTNTPTIELAVLFDDSVSGLTKGSEVRFQGIRVGQVSDLSAIINETSGEADVQLRAVLSLETGRIGMDANTTADEAFAFLADYVSSGLRARLSTANILSGALIVELIEDDSNAPASLDLAAQPYPILPTAEAAIADVAETAEDVLARIEGLPVEELLQGAIDLMASLERLANDEAVREVPEGLVALLDETRALVASEDVQGIPPDIRKAIADIDGLVESFVAAELAAQLSETLTTTSQAAANIAAGTETLPELSTQVETLMVKLQSLADKANALEIEGLIAEAQGTLVSIDSFIGAEGMEDLPAGLNASLEELRAALAELREGGAVENLNATLNAANGAAQAIEAATVDLPALAERADALVRETRAVVDGYSQRSRFGAETLTTLQDIQNAADAISALARTIQRNPSSLITGR